MSQLNSPESDTNQDYHRLKDNSVRDRIKRTLEQRGWNEANVINRYVVEKVSGEYSIQVGRSVFELSVHTRGRGNFFSPRRYNIRLDAEPSGNELWYEGDNPKQRSWEDEINFGLHGFEANHPYIEAGKIKIINALKGEIICQVDTKPNGESTNLNVKFLDRSVVFELD